MRPVMYFVSCVGGHWEVRCRSAPDDNEYPDRDSAIAAAKRAAASLWTNQRTASEVMIDDEDGRWHKVAAYGDLLG